MTTYRRFESEIGLVGWCHLSHLRNFQFHPLESSNFFVEPWDNRERSDCAIVHPPSGDYPPGVYFFLDKDDFLKNFPESILDESYLYGAYGQVNVLQLRVSGFTLLLEDGPQKEEVRNQILSRIEGRTKTNVDGLSIEESIKMARIVANGVLLKFVPEEFAYSTYERG